MQSIEQNGLTRQQVIDILKAKRYPRRILFKYWLLNKNDEFIRELDNITKCTVSNNSFADIKRTADITLIDDKNINYLSDRIQPWIIFNTPYGEIKWSMGIFLLNSPTATYKNNMSSRDIECYDKLQILMDDKLGERLVIRKNSNYILEILKIIQSTGETKINIPNSDKLLKRDREFEIGTTKLQVVNRLSRELNYTSLSVDEKGQYYAEPYILPTDRDVEFKYINDEYSIILDGITEELDLFSTPNKFIAIVSNPDTQPLRAEYINDNPNSATSTISRGRTIVGDVIELTDIADQNTLNKRVQRSAYKSNRDYQKISFSSAIMPFHSNNDTYRFKYFDSIDAVFNETSWSIDLSYNGKMQHKARRVVEI